MSKSFTKILVPVDFSKHSLEALQYAAAVAQRFQASVVALHVIAKEVVTVTAHQQHTGRRDLPPHAFRPQTEVMAETPVMQLFVTVSAGTSEGRSLASTTSRAR